MFLSPGSGRRMPCEHMTLSPLLHWATISDSLHVSRFTFHSNPFMTLYGPVRPGIARLLPPSLATRPLPPAHALATGQSRQNTGKAYRLPPSAKTGRMGPQ